jgi:hypothetical protein
MEFPKWKKKLNGLLSPLERVVNISKKVILSAGLLTFSSGYTAGQPKVPADRKQTLQDNQISKFSTKYLLRAAGRSGLSALFAQHRSHSSHSSHSSHYSSSSGTGHSSHASHASHYSSSYPTPAPAPSHSSHYSSSAPTPVKSPRVTTNPPRRSTNPTPLRTAKPAFGFSDSFEGNTRANARWIPGALNADESSFDTGVVVLERQGRLEITPRPNVAGRRFNGYMSAGEWDLTDAKASVEVVQTTGDVADTVFAIGIDSNNWYGFVMENGTLYLQSKVNAVKNPKAIPYNATGHRFLRFRLDSTNSTVTWETSPDGIAWEAQREETLQMDIARMHVTLSAGTYQVTKAPGMAVFDNFRLER